MLYYDISNFQNKLFIGKLGSIIMISNQLLRNIYEIRTTHQKERDRGQKKMLAHQSSQTKTMYVCLCL